MKDLVKHIKRNRLPQEVLYLLEKIEDSNNYYIMSDVEFEILDNKYTNYALFSIDTEDKIIDVFKWNIFIVFDSILSRNPAISNFNPGDEKSILSAIKNSKFSHYKINRF